MRSAYRYIQRLSVLVFEIVLLFLFGPSARAHNVDIVSTTFLDFTGYVIDSDAANAAAGYTRDGISAGVTVRYTATLINPGSFDYLLEFRLLDSKTNAVSLRLPNGTIATVAGTNDVVVLPTIDPRGLTIAVATRNYTVPLFPAITLDPNEKYTLEVRVSQRVSGSGGLFNFTGAVGRDGPSTFYHFSNRTSGDTALNMYSTVTSVGFLRSFAINSAPLQNGFPVQVTYGLRRYDDFLAATPSRDDVTILLEYQLSDEKGNAVPLQRSTESFTHPISSFVEGTVRTPAVAAYADVLHVTPADGVQLDPVNGVYKLRVTIRHQDRPASPLKIGNQIISPQQKLLHLTGEVRFGAIQTQISGVGNSPAGGLPVAGKVAASLQVPARGGIILGFPGHQFGSVLLNVLVRSDGIAEYNGATAVNITGPPVDNDQVANVTFGRQNVVLKSTGPEAKLTARLPTGFGVTTEISRQSRRLKSSIDFNGVPLTPQLRPSGGWTFTGPILAAEESKPLWFQCSGLTWQVAAGKFEMTGAGSVFYVRQLEIQRLENAQQLKDSSMSFKRSNEALFRFIGGVQGGTPFVMAGPNGEALLTASLAMNSGDMRTHFPYDASFHWSGGSLRIENDLVVAAGSELDGVQSVALSYNRDCLGNGCGGTAAGPAALSLEPALHVLTFTPDGGLTADGSFATPQPLKWGYISSAARFAHSVEPLSAANFLMAGSFLRGDQTQGDPDDTPGALLLSGSSVADATKMERPETAEYSAGLGNYSGLNFRPGAGGRGQSTIALTPTGLYPLSTRSKYYARWSGVSGIHEASSFTSTLRIYGYLIKFSNFGLSFLDNRNDEPPAQSRIQGSFHVPYPSDFDVPFERLVLDCRGGLRDMSIPPAVAAVQRQLSYWRADFRPLALRFDRSPAAECDPGAGFLVLAVEAHASTVGEILFGELGFLSDGNLITSAEANPAVPKLDGRLKLPATFELGGPANERYQVTTASDGYFNNYRYLVNGSPIGFLNIGGTMHVPFFEPLKVHLHTSGRAQPNDAEKLVDVMGGFRDASGHTFFNTTAGGSTIFDPDNVGYPAPTAVTAYRADTSETYNVRAKRDWSILPLDYPLTWNKTSRSFRSLHDQSGSLLVLTTQHQVDYLSAENAALVFGAQYNALPQLNLADIAFNAINDNTGIVHAFVAAGLGSAREAITDGLDTMNGALDANWHKFIQGPFDAGLQPVLDDLYNALQTDFAAGHLSPVTTVHKFVRTNPVSVASRFHGLTEFSTGGWNDELRGDLTKFSRALQAIRDILAVDAQGNHAIATRFLRAILNDFAANIAGGIIDSQINAFLEKRNPSLVEIGRLLDGLQGVLTAIQNEISAGQGFAREFDVQINLAPSDFEAVLTAYENDLNEYFTEIIAAGDSPFSDYTVAEVKGFMRQKLEDRFLGSTVAAALQRVMRERLYDLDSASRESIDSAFQQLNTVLRDLASSALAQLDTKATDFADDLAGVVSAARINGYAHIRGDSLNLLRLDAHAKFNIASGLEFDGFLQIKEMQSVGSSPDCGVSVGSTKPWTEVTLGATDVSLSWLSPNLHANCQTKFSFDNNERLIGLAGEFEVKGGLQFEGFNIRDMGAALAFGGSEHYLAAKLDVEFNYHRFAGGVFFGRSCDVSPLTLVDPKADKYLGNGSFTGGYAYGEAWYPLNEILGIPSSCFLNLVGGAGIGVFYFDEGPTFGGRWHYGVSGEVLCAIGVHGEIDLVGAKHGGEFTFQGTGTVGGSIGPCPFCADVSKDIGLTVHVRLNGDISYDLDL